MLDVHHEPPQGHLEGGLLRDEGQEALALTFQVEVRQNIKDLWCIEG